MLFGWEARPESKGKVCDKNGKHSAEAGECRLGHPAVTNVASILGHIARLCDVPRWAILWASWIGRIGRGLVIDADSVDCNEDEVEDTVDDRWETVQHVHDGLDEHEEHAQHHHDQVVVCDAISY